MTAVSLYDFKSQTVGLIFDTLHNYVNIDPMLELSFFISSDSFRINEKILSYTEINSISLYDSLFTCKKEDSSRMFRKQTIGNNIYYISGKSAFVYVSLEPDKPNIQQMLFLEKLTNNLISAFCKRRDEISIAYKELPFEELSFSDQKIVDSIVPIKIEIHFNYN